MLPVIDLHATDFTALYSLLCFIDDHSKKLNVQMPCVTFDQQLYIKAYEIVSTKNLDVFVRLGGFHQLMSFLGSIGCMMEGSGLRNAPVTVYAPVTVGHMETGKPFASAVRGHFLYASAVTSLILQEFWDSLNSGEQKQLIELYDSEDLSTMQFNDLAMKLLSWYKKKKYHLSSKSRTSALWLNYLQYVNVAQEFIRAERTSNWSLHISATKNMLNLFAATGHNNYAKSCRLYLQSIASLKTEKPVIYEQYIVGHHTVRRTEKKWSGIWTDLAIEQILMKSLKGRGGVIDKGLTENVLRVWTKTMHRCAEVSDTLCTLTFPPKSVDKHKELYPGRTKRDYDDFGEYKNMVSCSQPILSR